MIGRIFNHLMGAAGRARAQRSTPAEGELQRQLMALMISGPVGGTDPVLHTLLLDSVPTQPAGARGRPVAAPQMPSGQRRRKVQGGRIHAPRVKSSCGSRTPRSA